MKLLTIKEVADRLQVSISLVYAITQRGELPCYRIGSCRRVSERDLLEYLESRRREPESLPQSKSVHF